MGCGDLTSEVGVSEQRVRWFTSAETEFVFQRDEYMQAVVSASRNTTWETLERTAERLVNQLDFSGQSAAGLEFQWASARIDHGKIALSFLAKGRQVLHSVRWKTSDPFSAVAAVQEWLGRGA